LHALDFLHFPAGLVITKLWLLCLEHDADEVLFPPHQPTFARGPEPVKRQIKFYRQDIQPLQMNAGTGICQVANPTRKHTGLRPEKYQCISVDQSSADSASFGFFVLSKFPD
jgi:hypothetical protein